MHYLERDEFIIGRRATGNEEERGVTSINNFGVCGDLGSADCCEEANREIVTFVLKEVTHTRSPRENEL